MEITTGIATPKLLDQLYEIEKQSFRKEAFTRQQIAYLLKDYNAISIFAQVGNEVVGFAIGRIEVACETPFGHILTLETSMSCRRRGVGQKLLEEMEALFAEKGVLESHLEVRENNTAAIRLYMKLGYERVGRLKRYYGDSHGLYLRKSILPGSSISKFSTQKVPPSNIDIRAQR